MHKICIHGVLPLVSVVSVFYYYFHFVVLLWDREELFLLYWNCWKHFLWNDVPIWRPIPKNKSYSTIGFGLRLFKWAVLFPCHSFLLSLRYSLFCF